MRLSLEEEKDERIVVHTTFSYISSQKEVLLVAEFS
jgi:hypothetical protein